MAPRRPRPPRIVMLHEGLGCVALWRDFPARLAAATGWGVFAWSRQGYGRSDPCPLPRPLDYMSDEALRVLPEVLDGDRLSARRPARPQRRRLDRRDLRRQRRGPPRARPRADGAALLHRAVRPRRDRGGQGSLEQRRPARAPGQLPRRCRLRVPRLERRLARPGLRGLEHHRAAGLHPRPGPGDPGRGGSVRHAAPRSRRSRTSFTARSTSRCSPTAGTRPISINLSGRSRS